MVITTSVCPKCGIIAKSGKSSCCGRGGSWFKNCGGSGNTKLQHTWNEGIQACKARSQSTTNIRQQINDAQERIIDSSQGDSMANDKAVIAATKTFAFASVNTSTLKSVTSSVIASIYTPGNVSIAMLVRTSKANESAHILKTSSTQTSVSKAITTQGYPNPLNNIGYIYIFFIMIFY